MLKRTYKRLTAYTKEQSEQHLGEVRAIYREMRGYKHDFHNHLQTLKGYLDAGEYDRASAYIAELDDRITHVDTLIKTGNVTVDAVLSAKLSQAKEAKIRTTVTATVPETTNGISDVELGIVIANLLDNAVESCRTLPEDDRFLRLYIARKGNMLYFSMLNAAGKKQTKEDGLFSSSKAQSQTSLHGFGLRRAREILTSHTGYLRVASEDGAFSTEFLLPLQ